LRRMCAYAKLSDMRRSQRLIGIVTAWHPTKNRLRFRGRLTPIDAVKAYRGRIGIVPLILNLGA